MARLYLGSEWARSGSSFAVGHATYERVFLSAHGIATLLDAAPSGHEWAKTVGRLNGCFAVITERDAILLAAVDRLRTIPLFYRTSPNGIELSSDAYALVARGAAAQVDKVVAAEFYLTGYTTGQETLLAGIKQLPAGQWLTAEVHSVPVLRKYYEFLHRNFFLEDRRSLIDRLDSIHTHVFRRLVQSAEGRPLIVPLSGGYDSRLIVASLKALGVKDVVCYSYGTRESWESRISKEVAAYLGYRWEFVEYSADLWRRWSQLGAFREFVRYASNLSSIAHVQDWPAILELRRKRVIPSEAVVVPGHSGDFLAGSHIPAWFARRKVIRREQIMNSILSKHYSLWEWRPEFQELRAVMAERIEAITGRIHDCSPEAAADVFELWDLQERQAKFICNSTRVYDFFKMKWRLPLFDHELMDFWTRIPMDLRVGRKLYFRYADERQALPVRRPNSDRPAAIAWLVWLGDRAGLRRPAQAIRHRVNKLKWRQEYEGSKPLAWLAVVDREFFRQTYTGRETLHSYMARRYLDELPADLASRGIQLAHGQGFGLKCAPETLRLLDPSGRR